MENLEETLKEINVSPANLMDSIKEIQQSLDRKEENRNEMITELRVSMGQIKTSQENQVKFADKLDTKVDGIIETQHTHTLEISEIKNNLSAFEILHDDVTTKIKTDISGLKKAQKNISIVKKLGGWPKVISYIIIGSVMLIGFIESQFKIFWKLFSN